VDGDDPVSKLLLVALVGQRSLAVTQTVVHLVKQRLAPGCLPLFTTDGLAHYQTALLTHFGHWLQPPPTPSIRPSPLGAMVLSTAILILAQRETNPFAKTGDKG